MNEQVDKFMFDICLSCHLTAYFASSYASTFWENFHACQALKEILKNSQCYIKGSGPEWYILTI